MNAVNYEIFLVGLSYVISVYGSYTALQFALAIPQGRTWAAVIASVAGAALALGGATWSMHFIGMNAADMGIPVTFDPALTIAALVLAIIAAGAGLFVVGRSDGGAVNLPLGALLTGLGIASMQYTGMAAMVLPAKVSYDLALFGTSILIAVAAAAVALWLAFNLSGKLQRFGSALLIGIAVCAVHYTAMYALKLEPTNAAVAGTGSSSETAAYSVFGVTAVILTLLLAYSAWNSRRALAADS